MGGLSKKVRGAGNKEEKAFLPVISCLETEEKAVLAEELQFILYVVCVSENSKLRLLSNRGRRNGEGGGCWIRTSSSPCMGLRLGSGPRGPCCT